MQSAASSTITVYGKPDCVDTLSVRDTLASLGLDYEWRDVVGRDDLAEEAMQLNGGVDRWPTVVIRPGAVVLVEPSAPELTSRLGAAE